MRYIYLLLITFIFAACGNQKMRFVRTKSSKQKIVTIAETPTQKSKTETNYTPRSPEESTESETKIGSTKDTQSYAVVQDDPENVSNSVSNSFPISVQDSTTRSAEETAEMTRTALRAERQGNWSFGLSLMFFGLVLLSILVFGLAIINNYSVVGLIISILLAVLSIGSVISSFILATISLRARYNTERGRRRAIAGLIISSILIGIFIANILFGIF